MPEAYTPEEMLKRLLGRGAEPIPGPGGRPAAPKTPEEWAALIDEDVKRAGQHQRWMQLRDPAAPLPKDVTPEELKKAQGYLAGYPPGYFKTRPEEWARAQEIVSALPAAAAKVRVPTPTREQLYEAQVAVPQREPLGPLQRYLGLGMGAEAARPAPPPSPTQAWHVAASVANVPIEIAKLPATIPLGVGTLAAQKIETGEDILPQLVPPFMKHMFKGEWRDMLIEMGMDPLGTATILVGTAGAAKLGTRLAARGVTGVPFRGGRILLPKQVREFGKALAAKKAIRLPKIVNKLSNILGRKQAAAVYRHEFYRRLKKGVLRGVAERKAIDAVTRFHRSIVRGAKEPLPAKVPGPREYPPGFWAEGIIPEKSLPLPRKGSFERHQRAEAKRGLTALRKAQSREAGARADAARALAKAKSAYDKTRKALETKGQMASERAIDNLVKAGVTDKAKQSTAAQKAMQPYADKYNAARSRYSAAVRRIQEIETAAEAPGVSAAHARTLRGEEQFAGARGGVSPTRLPVEPREFVPKAVAVKELAVLPEEQVAGSPGVIVARAQKLAREGRLHPAIRERVEAGVVRAPGDAPRYAGKAPRPTRFPSALQQAAREIRHGKAAHKLISRRATTLGWSEQKLKAEFAKATRVAVARRAESEGWSPQQLQAKLAEAAQRPISQAPAGVLDEVVKSTHRVLGRRTMFSNLTQPETALRKLGLDKVVDGYHDATYEYGRNLDIHRAWFKRLVDGAVKEAGGMKQATQEWLAYVEEGTLPGAKVKALGDAWIDMSLRMAGKRAVPLARRRFPYAAHLKSGEVRLSAQHLRRGFVKAKNIADVNEVIEAYLRNSLGRIHTGPAVEALEKALADIGVAAGKEPIRAAVFSEKLLASLRGGLSEETSWINLGMTADQARVLTTPIYAGALSMPSSWLANLMQNINTLADAGIWNAVRAWAAKRPYAGYLKRARLGRDPTLLIEYLAFARNKPGAVRALMDKVGRKMLWGFGKVERFNKAHGYTAPLDVAKRAGHMLRDAERIAWRGMQSTQYAYGPMNVPLAIQQAPLASTFMTFPTRQAGLLHTWWKQRPEALVRYAALTYGAGRGIQAAGVSPDPWTAMGWAPGGLPPLPKAALELGAAGVGLAAGKVEFAEERAERGAMAILGAVGRPIFAGLRVKEALKGEVMSRYGPAGLQYRTERLPERVFNALVYATGAQPEAHAAERREKWARGTFRLDIQAFRMKSVDKVEVLIASDLDDDVKAQAIDDIEKRVGAETGYPLLGASYIGAIKRGNLTALEREKMRSRWATEEFERRFGKPKKRTLRLPWLPQ